MKNALMAAHHSVEACKNENLKYPSSWTPAPDFWEDHPEVCRGPVGWQLTRMYGPRCLAQLDRMQRLQRRLVMGLVPNT
jgi:hypothetical protein